MSGTCWNSSKAQSCSRFNCFGTLLVRNRSNITCHISFSLVSARDFYWAKRAMKEMWLVLHWHNTWSFWLQISLKLGLISGRTSKISVKTFVCFLPLWVRHAFDFLIAFSHCAVADSDTWVLPSPHGCRGSPMPRPRKGWSLTWLRGRILCELNGLSLHFAWVKWFDACEREINVKRLCLTPSAWELRSLVLVKWLVEASISSVS